MSCHLCGLAGQAVLGAGEGVSVHGGPEVVLGE